LGELVGSGKARLNNMHRRFRSTHYEGVSVYGCPNASSTQGKELRSLAIISPPHPPHYTHHLKHRKRQCNSPKGWVGLASFHPLTPKGWSVYGWPKERIYHRKRLSYLPQRGECAWFPLINSSRRGGVCMAGLWPAQPYYTSLPLWVSKFDFISSSKTEGVSVYGWPSTHTKPKGVSVYACLKASSTMRNVHPTHPKVNLHKHWNFFGQKVLIKSIRISWELNDWHLTFEIFLNWNCKNSFGWIDSKGLIVTGC